ncbi:unnamed protein product, partial [Mesorhabditis spiculigera]
MYAEPFNFPQLPREAQQSVLRHLDFLFKVHLRSVSKIFFKWPACAFYLRGRLTRITLEISSNWRYLPTGTSIYFRRRIINGNWVDKVSFVLTYDEEDQVRGDFVLRAAHHCWDRYGWTECRNGCKYGYDCSFCTRFQLCPCCGSLASHRSYPQMKIEGVDSAGHGRLLQKFNDILPCAPVRLKPYMMSDLVPMKWPLTHQGVLHSLRRDYFFISKQLDDYTERVHRRLLEQLAPIYDFGPSKVWYRMDLFYDDSSSAVHRHLMAVLKEMVGCEYFAIGQVGDDPKRWPDALKTVRNLITECIFSHPPVDERRRIALFYVEMESKSVLDHRPKQQLQKLLLELCEELKARPAESRDCRIFCIEGRQINPDRPDLIILGVYVFLVQNWGSNAGHAVAAYRQLIANFHKGDHWDPMSDPQGDECSVFFTLDRDGKIFDMAGIEAKAQIASSLAEPRNWWTCRTLPTGTKLVERQRTIYQPQLAKSISIRCNDATDFQWKTRKRAFDVLAPGYFVRVRSDLGIEEAEFKRHLCELPWTAVDPGNSTSQPFATVNRRFLLKGQQTPTRESPEDELEVLRELLPHYKQETKRFSFLPCFLAAVANKNLHIRFIVTPHLGYNLPANSYIFDIKPAGRRKKETSQVHREKDFKSICQKGITLSPEDRQLVVSTIKRDVEFLVHHNIRDYSMLMLVDFRRQSREQLQQQDGHKEVLATINKVTGRSKAICRLTLIDILLKDPKNPADVQQYGADFYACMHTQIFPSLEDQPVEELDFAMQKLVLANTGIMIFPSQYLLQLYSILYYHILSDYGHSLVELLVLVLLGRQLKKRYRPKSRNSRLVKSRNGLEPGSSS